MHANRTIAAAFEWICAAEDSWTWIALLCGNHLGQLPAFVGF